jgi:hypothetical protein
MLVCLATAYAIKVHSPILRPIWFDEFTQFAFGAEQSTAEAWSFIRTSIQDPANTHQTGILALVNYWSLSLAGADLWALRWPSVLATMAMFSGVILTLQAAGLDPLWQVLGVVAVSLQPELMHFTAEARPYIFLCAAVSLTLAYYVAEENSRATASSRIAGYGGVITGCLFHPYFAVYWSGIAAATWIGRVIAGNAPLSVRSAVRHAGPILVPVGACLYFGIGAMTWIGSSSPEFDPLQWLGNHALDIGVWTHLSFVSSTLGPRRATTLVVSLAVLAIARCGPKSVMRDALPPLFIFGVAAAASCLISWVSFRSSYWILQRQWVASLMLVPIASVWLIGCLARAALTLRRTSILYASSAILLIALGFRLQAERLRSLSDQGSRVDVQTSSGSGSVCSPGEASAGTSSCAIDADAFLRLPHSEEIDWVQMANTRYPADKREAIQTLGGQWVAAANANIAAGGPVRQEFGKFYCSVRSIRNNKELLSKCLSRGAITAPDLNTP